MYHYRQLEVGESYITNGLIMYDAVYIPGGRQSANSLMTQGEALYFVNEAFKHVKAIGAGRIKSKWYLPDQQPIPLLRPLNQSAKGWLLYSAGAILFSYPPLDYGVYILIWEYIKSII